MTFPAAPTPAGPRAEGNPATRVNIPGVGATSPPVGSTGASEGAFFGSRMLYFLFAGSGGGLGSGGGPQPTDCAGAGRGEADGFGDAACEGRGAAC